MKPLPGRGWLIVGLGLAALVAILFVLTGVQRTQHFGEPLDVDQRGVGLRTVTVYYVAADTLVLVPQDRTMIDRGSRRAVVEELVLFLSETSDVLRSPLPHGTHLAHVFENRHGELVIDLAGPLDAETGGSLLEDQLRLTAFARTLAENVEGLDHLRLLVHGRPLLRWGRHIRIKESLELASWL